MLSHCHCYHIFTVNQFFEAQIRTGWFCSVTGNSTVTISQLFYCPVLSVSSLSQTKPDSNICGVLFKCSTVLPTFYCSYGDQAARKSKSLCGSLAPVPAQLLDHSHQCRVECSPGDTGVSDGVRGVYINTSVNTIWQYGNMVSYHHCITVSWNHVILQT